ncbi:DUF72 domain-containing protein [Streptomyces sp. NPDC005648]|uniref:DUF72 domain-containing protein n=1 Tax=Streptomyces sp. NPDC005648 TaxID=3157044 RepID=UPI0033BE3909
MGEILVGTCSWTDRALVDSGWYPPGRRDPEGRLRHYAERFPVVEADSTYYALPNPRITRQWAERTPDGFVFDVKAFSLLTGHPTRPSTMPKGLPADPRSPKVLDEVWARFTEGIEPLLAAGRLGTVLFQLPPWLRPGRRAGQFLHDCAERTAGWPVAVEFRHPGWWRDEWAEATRALLSRHGMTAVAVDMNQSLPRSIPPVTPVTSPQLSVVRFHGRSPAWGTGTKEDRFRHDYTEPELLGWLPRLRDLAARVDQLHVLFNNCCGTAAVRAAESMARRTARDAPGTPTGRLPSSASRPPCWTAAAATPTSGRPG